jgi:hypothetical protein
MKKRYERRVTRVSEENGFGDISRRVSETLPLQTGLDATTWPWSRSLQTMTVFARGLHQSRLFGATTSRNLSSGNNMGDGGLEKARSRSARRMRTSILPSFVRGGSAGAKRVRADSRASMIARSGSRLTLVHQPSGIHPKGSPWRIARAKRDAGFVGHDATQSKDPERRPPLRSSPPARQELAVAPPTPSTTAGLPSGLGRSLVILDSQCVACLSHQLNLRSRDAQKLENPLRSAPNGTCAFYMGNYRDIFTSRVRTEIHGFGASRRAQFSDSISIHAVFAGPHTPRTRAWNR